MASHGLFKLPIEIRVKIYSFLVIPGRVLLSKTPYMKELEVTSTQPAISLVNRQFREEALDVFYSNNNFIFKLFDAADVNKITRYLAAIGPKRAQRIRRVTLCAFAKLGFGHMLFKWWWKVDLHLRNGTISWDRNITWSDERRLQQSFKTEFEIVMKQKQGDAWTTEELVGLMENFTLTCTAC